MAVNNLETYISVYRLKEFIRISYICLSMNLSVKFNILMLFIGNLN
jgi:hypothetical protein